MKFKFGYKYLFYSFYVYYKYKWDMSKDWPQGWAMFAMSFVFIVLISIILMLLDIKGVSLASIVPFKDSSIPGYVKNSWLGVTIIIINNLFFLKKRRWEKLVVEFDSLDKEVRVFNHSISVVFIITLLLMLLGLGLT